MCSPLLARIIKMPVRTQAGWPAGPIRRNIKQILIQNVQFDIISVQNVQGRRFVQAQKPVGRQL
jgi:hypothetical protein